MIAPLVLLILFAVKVLLPCKEVPKLKLPPSVNSDFFVNGKGNWKPNVNKLLLICVNVCDLR